MTFGVQITSDDAKGIRIFGASFRLLTTKRIAVTVCLKRRKAYRSLLRYLGGKQEPDLTAMDTRT